MLRCAVLRCSLHSSTCFKAGPQLPWLSVLVCHWKLTATTCLKSAPGPHTGWSVPGVQEQALLAVRGDIPFPELAPGGKEEAEEAEEELPPSA